MSASVVLPTYNEREAVVPLVREVLGAVPEAEVVVVDDDSPDRTWAAVEAAFAGDPRVRVLRRIGSSSTHRRRDTGSSSTSTMARRSA